MLANLSIEKLSSLKGHIHGLIDSLCNNQDITLIEVAKHCLLQNYLLSQKLTDQETEKFLDDFEVKQYIIKLREYNIKYEQKLENMLSNYFSSHIDNPDIRKEGFILFLKTYYSEFYKLLSQSELAISDLKNAKKICMVGVGSMPLSFLFIRRFSKAKVIGLDTSEIAIKNANAFLDYVSQARPEIYSKRDFELYCSDGDRFDYSDVDGIIMSVYVNNKDAVFKQILKYPYKRNLIIVERNVTGLGNYFYQNYSFKIQDFPIKILESRKTGIITSTAYCHI